MRTRRPAVQDRSRLSALLQVTRALVAFGCLAVGAPAARGASVEIAVEIAENEDHPDKRTLQGLIRTACKKPCDPHQEVANRVVAALRELFPVHDFAPADPAVPRPYRLRVVVSSSDPTVQSTMLEMQLIDRSRPVEVVLRRLESIRLAPPTASKPALPGPARPAFPSLLTRTQDVLLESWGELAVLVRLLPIQRLDHAEALATARPAERSWPAHSYIDTGLDALELAPGHTPVLLERLVFMLRWPDDRAAPVHFLMCDPHIVRGPVIRYPRPDDRPLLPGCPDSALAREEVGALPAGGVTLYLGGLWR